MIPPKAVTLATLNESTAQEVFDWVVFNLLRQNKRSENANRQCLYRGPDGLKCAAGWIIADDEYDPAMETTSWTFNVDEFELPPEHRQLITRLQNTHDGDPPSIWKGRFRYTANSLGLNTKVLDSLG